MQLFACDENNQIVSVARAKKQHNYTCLECRNPVRRKGGEHLRQHFFHLQPNAKCRQSKKGLIHIHLQKLLEQLLPKGQCVLEKMFPQIGRIADVVWEEQGLIFEVQCSGISAEEVQGRNDDYATLGYQVIWLLHDRRFNRLKVTAAEKALRTSPHYFANMNGKGIGYVYDQMDLIVKGRRHCIHKPFPINLTQPKWLNGNRAISEHPTPTILTERLEHWPVHFASDLIDCYLSRNPTFERIFLDAVHEEAKWQSKYRTKWKRICFSCFYWLVVRPYLLILQIFLEKASK